MSAHTSFLEMRRDLEAAAKLEEKLRKADQEAAALKEQQRRNEAEKVKMAAIAAQQKQQSEKEVRMSKHSWDLVMKSPSYSPEEEGCRSGG